MKRFITSLISDQTKASLKFDFLRLKARIGSRKKNLIPKHSKLHLGCGKRNIEGWLNVDIADSDHNIDLGSGKLPWRDKVFDCVVSQHVIEHLHLEKELLPLIKELGRVMKTGSEIWLSTPDLEKVTNSYSLDFAKSLVQDRQTRFPNFSLNDIPSQHFINKLFHQEGQHKNLFDFDMIKWMLEKNGFKDCARVVEADLLNKMPEFPRRNDDIQSVYVRAHLAQ